MLFEDFISAPRCIAMVITVGEYTRIRNLLQESYTSKDIMRIDDFCKFKPDHERFLLCNQAERAEARTPLMLLSAVTFVDRIPYRRIKFNKEVT